MIIKQEHLIESIHSALQYISYYHSPDFISAMVSAYERETSQSAKNAIEQILINSKMCALGKRPICQDTGIVNVFVEVGMNVDWDCELELEDMINEGVRRDLKIRYHAIFHWPYGLNSTRGSTQHILCFLTYCNYR